MGRKVHEANLVSILVAGSIASAQIRCCHPGRMFQAQYSCLCLLFPEANETYNQMQIQNPKTFESFNSARL